MPKLDGVDCRRGEIELRGERNLDSIQNPLQEYDALGQDKGSYHQELCNILSLVVFFRRRLP